MPRVWEEQFRSSCKYFTVGKGKARYDLWKFGPCGLAYCYQIDSEGYACKRRAVEPNQTVFVHIV